MKEGREQKLTCFVPWYQKYNHGSTVVRGKNKSTATKHANSGMPATAMAAL